MHKIGIVTVTYNSGVVIEAFLRSLSKQTYGDWTLYLVDNTSTDDTLAKVDNFSNLPIYRLDQQQNIGFAAGSNIGIKQALADGCQYILLINNDVEFADNFLEILYLQAKTFHNDIVAPKMMYFTPNNKIWAAGGGFKPSLAWAAYQQGENELDHGQYDQNLYCDFVPMCCVLIRADIFEKVGLLDEKYFIYSEDSDWFYRAKLCGVKLLYCYQAILYHKVSSLTGGASSKIGASYGTRNRIYFICKHFSGIKRMEYLLKYSIGMIVSLINGKYSWQEFKWRVPAFWRGLRL